MTEYEFEAEGIRIRFAPGDPMLVMDAHGVCLGTFTPRTAEVSAALDDGCQITLSPVRFMDGEPRCVKLDGIWVPAVPLSERPVGRTSQVLRGEGGLADG